MSNKIVISHFNSRNDFLRLLQNNPGLVIIKLGATWCGPCKRIKPVLDGFFASSPDNVICCDIDVDECSDLYTYFKSKKMVNGIPVILLYKKGNTSYIPDDSVTGADAVELDKFFRRCSLHLRAII
jgi:thioredoxin 1